MYTLALALIATTTAGCSASEEQTFADAIMNSPYRADFEEALTHEQVSQFQKDILIDGIITDAERDEALSRLETCFEDLGYSLAVSVFPTVQFSIGDGGTGDSQEVVQAAFDECDGKFSSTVTSLHGALKNNPDRLDWRLLTLNCLKRHGLVDATFTVEQIEEDFNDPGGIIMSDTHTCIDDPQN